MCGITGIADSTGPVHPEVLRRMANTLRRRGPDDESYHIPEPKARRSCRWTWFSAPVYH